MDQSLRTFLIAILAIAGPVLTCSGDTTDNYQLYLGKNLILTERSFANSSSTTLFFQIDGHNYRETLNINVSHCTYGSGTRQVKLMDSAGNAVMTWKYSEDLNNRLMSISIESILANSLVKANKEYRLYYQDEAYPAW